VEKGISRSHKAGPERSDEHPGRRTESRYAMNEQLLVYYGAKESCAGLRVLAVPFTDGKRTGEPASQRTKRNSAKDYKGLNFITPNDGHARGIRFH
jgi:hypothetical protein